MFATMIFAAAVGAPSCWGIFDDALRRRARSTHPPFVSYDVRQNLIADREQVFQARSHVQYRDDGLARVEDSRFNDEPFVTRQADPGPPELGPYGKDRRSWLPLDDPQMPYRIIGDVRTHGDVQCTLVGTERYKGYQTYHLAFTHMAKDRPAVKEVWIDTTTADIWKLIVSGYVVFSDVPESPLTDFQVELSYAGPYLVVDHVTWAYRLHEYSQYENLFGEYYFSDFSYPKSLPASLFAIGPPAPSS